MLKSKAEIEIHNILRNTEFENKAEMFRFLNKIQNDLVNDIEYSCNKNLLSEVQRLSLYQLSKAVSSYHKKKNKEKDLHILVSLFCASVRREENIFHSSPIEKELLEILISHKEHILDNEAYYDRFLPEHKWFTNYLKNI